MPGVLWGGLGASLIGVSDCIARVTAQRVSLSVLFLAVMGLSTLVLTAWLAVTGDWPRWDTYGWVASAVSGALTLVALFFLYKALARGPVSVASPAASSFSVMLVAINVVAGAPFVWQQGVAILMVFGGVTMLARRGRSETAHDPAHLRVTALLGLASALAIALRMFLAQEASEILGVVGSLYLNRLFALAGVVVLLAYETTRGGVRRWPDRATLPLVGLQSILETVAMASFLVGSAGTGRIGAAIGFAGFSAVTALTAWLWLKEPVGWRRSLWMAVVGAGIALAVAAAPN